MSERGADGGGRGVGIGGCGDWLDVGVAGGGWRWKMIGDGGKRDLLLRKIVLIVIHEGI